MHLAGCIPKKMFLVSYEEILNDITIILLLLKLEQINFSQVKRNAEKKNLNAETKNARNKFAPMQ